MNVLFDILFLLLNGMPGIVMLRSAFIYRKRYKDALEQGEENEKRLLWLRFLYIFWLIIGAALFIYGNWAQWAVGYGSWAQWAVGISFS